jgi:UDP-2,3-diacylglucosamine pyrophosphatase LpxH
MTDTKLSRLKRIPYFCKRLILESFPDIRDRFLRLGEDSIGARLLLGNHDLEVRQARDFERARMVHYLPGTNETVLATHGDSLDFWEVLIPDEVATFVLQTFGKLATPQTYPMATLRTLRDQTTPQDQRLQIQGDAVYAQALGEVSGDLPERFNIIDVYRPEDRAQAHRLLPNAVRTIQELRTRVEDNDQPIAAHLRVMVIGHSHHARVVVDHTANLVLMDCGAWIEHYQVGQEEKRPNRQIGALCGADLRIYQLDATPQV